MPKLIVKRGKAWVDGWRSYVLYLDGEKVGKIKEDKEIIFEVEPGEHTLRARIDCCTTKTLHFTVSQTDLQFLVKSNLGGWKMLLSCIYVFIPSKWISLEPIT